MSSLSDADIIRRRIASVEARQAELEARQTDLEDATVRLAGSVDALKRRIETLPASIGQQLKSQTDEIGRMMAESERRNADRVLGVARSWPAPALVATGAALSLVIGLLLYVLGVIQVP